MKKAKSKIRGNVVRKAEIKSILLVIFCTVLTAIGQILFKYSINNINSIHAIITNIPLILGFVCYGSASVLLILALRRGNLSVIYPFIALSFIWVTILSIILFHEQVFLRNWIGIVSIMLGVSLIGIGSSK